MTDTANRPHILSWSINHGDNRIEDFWMLQSDLNDAQHCLVGVVWNLPNLHCWAISLPVSTSEPHWCEEGGA